LIKGFPLTIALFIAEHTPKGDRHLVKITGLLESVVLMASLATAAAAQYLAPPPSLNALPTIYVSPADGFQTAITAAMIKKSVPVTIVTEQGKAEFILQAAPVNSKDESGAGKIARCMFLNCIGINGYSSVSVQLVKISNGNVVWAYQVRKAMSGPAGIQSLSEAIAKHLKNDYLDKKTKW
jgi:hypothetical protein